MFSAVTAALLDAGQRPRAGLGTWSHADLPVGARHALARPLGEGRASDVRRRLQSGYKVRVQADYEPRLAVDQETVRRLVSYASAVVRTVRQ